MPIKGAFFFLGTRCPHIAAGNVCPIMRANGRKGGWKKGRKRKRAKIPAKPA